MPRPRLRNRQRVAFPGIYDDPRVIADRAEANVDPESPYLEEIFGVRRADLADMAREVQGDPNWTFPGAAPNPKGSESAYNIMTPSNTQRLVNQLEAFQERAPGMVEGMQGWYMREPLRRFMGEFSNNPDADFDRYSALTAMASPGSDVYTEINRGSAALYHANQGDWDTFAKMSLARPIEGVMGHPYHSTAQVPAMAKFLEHGQIMSKEPKVPSYFAAGTGRQSNMAVGDAHWSRGVGLADVRTSKKFDASATGPEMQMLQPWWADITGQADLLPVPGQAINWGGLALETGVESRVGVPKLELEANAAGTLAAKRGISPQQAMARISTGLDIAPSRAEIDAHMRDRMGGYASIGGMAAAGGAGVLAMMASGESEAGVFNPRRVGRTNYDEDFEYRSEKYGFEGDVRQMTTDEYLDEAAGILSQQEGYQVTPERLIETRQSEVPEMAALMQEKGDFDIPYLDYTERGRGQEGITRALAARELGEEPFPVLTVRDRRQEALATNPDIAFNQTLSGYSDDTMRWLESHTMDDLKREDISRQDRYQAERELAAYRSELNRRGLPSRNQGFADIGLAAGQAALATGVGMATMMGGELRSLAASLNPFLSDEESLEVQKEARSAALYEPESELGQGYMRKIESALGYLDPGPALEYLAPDELEILVKEGWEALPERTQQMLEGIYYTFSPI